ncbi:hypothetical protein GOBAR_AA23448 [Gossypium barbadense]|uniref:GIL1/IRKI C-terminal domain-containing protein n=1 Tax=Gossypium barbadense TaxID=3634 RepID=A0A2P5X1K2_GOSBA|nr:hypothetical protein GOBAR_AA23448 [Gossypium barbadense]
MECSFFGNLNQRKLVTSSRFPDAAFFTTFVEISRRFWLLHCLGISMREQISIFEVKKDCSFSEIYMENVTKESLLSGEINDGNVDIRVSFTVVLGFKIGATVIQSQISNELVVEDGKVNFNIDEVNSYGGNLSNHNAVEGVGHGGVGVVEA